MGQPEEQDPVEATTTAWARERPGISVEGMGLVTRLWHVAKLCGDQRRRVISEHGADQAGGRGALEPDVSSEDLPQRARSGARGGDRCRQG